MRTKFPGHFRPTDAEFEDLWQNATIVLDTSVLLNLYRISSTAANEFLDLLGAYRDRLWIPHHVAKEYLKNRTTVIGKECKKYLKLIGDLESMVDAIEGEKSHPFVPEDLANRFKDIAEELKAALTGSEDDHRGLLSNDRIRDAIEGLFNGRVGEAWTEDRLQQVYTEGKERYENKVPPGFADLKEKPEPDRYGDLVIWLQVIEWSESQSKHVIMLTNDKKEDWFEEASGRTLGPLPQLRFEFAEKTNKTVYLYSPSQFIGLANSRGEQVSENTINEVAKLEESGTSSSERAPRPDADLVKWLQEIVWNSLAPRMGDYILDSSRKLVQRGIPFAAQRKRIHRDVIGRLRKDIDDILAHSVQNTLEHSIATDLLDAVGLICLGRLSVHLENTIVSVFPEFLEESED
ncbi:MAG: PIN domain-containing protein [Planctomycetaceae bacterium]